MSGGGGSETAVVRASSLREALTLRALGSITSGAWAAYLGRQRWFGAKAGRPRGVRVRDVVPLPWEAGAFALARLEVVLGDGQSMLYQLPLAVRPEANAATNPNSESPNPESRIPNPDGIAPIQIPSGTGILFDATQSAAFRRGLADCFTGGAVFESEGVRWTIASVGEKAMIVPPNVPIRLGSAEQSNTSVIFDQEAILKLFRKLERGPQPDVELTRFLTLEASFAHTPALLGMVRVEDAEGTAVAGMLQEFLPGSEDAWAFALARARPYFEAPAGANRPNEFLIEAERLGQVTRELHDALASGRSPELAPQETTPGDVERWAARTKQWMRDGFALLERQLQEKTLPRERMGEAQALIGRRERYLGSVDEIVDTLAGDAGQRMRIHGDYHLGQVLRTASDDFMIIDFEGEPARSLAERREKASPLRDVAGMLRSFAYAAASAGMEAKALDVGTRELRIGRWERDVRAAFLRGYLDPSASEPGAPRQRSAILPRSDAHTQALLRLFESEKAFYELVYELNNRPSWMYIPLRGIAKLLT